MAHYRKIQLYGPREKAIYTPGDAYTVFDLAGIRTALLICYDMEFAPHIAALAAKGVHLILGPTASMQPFSYVVRHAVPALAAHHGLTIAYANYCGTEGDLDYLGGSLIADPYGDASGAGRARASPADCRPAHDARPGPPVHPSRRFPEDLTCATPAMTSCSNR